MEEEEDLKLNLIESAVYFPIGPSLRLQVEITVGNSIQPSKAHMCPFPEESLLDQSPHT